ncbi:MAG: family 43 glycosylhydrolase [Clostridia bacterium]|nr:family 43 glycosylhydrolase [Clostridia bacterium]
MTFKDINIRDPFILTHGGKYYMYGTRARLTWDQRLNGYGFDVYVSEDMNDWQGPISIFEKKEGFWGQYDYWAPEVHYYKGKFYMFASFKGDGYHRGTAILVSDTPDGEFKEHSCGAITPSDWECLDGTFYIENDTPYIVFCHEWTQVHDGEVCALRLTPDLKSAVGEPILLWKASQANWKYDIRDYGAYVTDGPFLVKNGKDLICIWSSFSKGEYVEAIARSDNGSILGNWTIDDKLMYEKDGGHGMIFTDLKGQLSFVYHAPNETPNERPVVNKISLSDLF